MSFFLTILSFFKLFWNLEIKLIKIKISFLQKGELCKHILCIKYGLIENMKKLLT